MRYYEISDINHEVKRLAESYILDEKLHPLQGLGKCEIRIIPMEFIKHLAFQAAKEVGSPY